MIPVEDKEPCDEESCDTCEADGPDLWTVMADLERTIQLMNDRLDKLETKKTTRRKTTKK